jgi:hypothetical protein
MPVCHAGEMGSIPIRGASNLACSSIGRGHQFLTLERWVRFPYGLLASPKRGPRKGVRPLEFRGSDPFSGTPFRGGTRSGQVVEQKTHGPQKAGPRKGVRVQLSPWSLFCRYGRRLLGFHKAAVPGSLPGPATFLRVGQCSGGVHIPTRSGATPGPAT